MSRKRRNFSAKFKSDLVIELLKGEKDLNTLATENNIQPNLLRNWKREFLNNASAVFDDKRENFLLLLAPAYLISTVQVLITKNLQYLMMNWHVKRSLIISIRIIQPGVQDRCLHN